MYFIGILWKTSRANFQLCQFVVYNVGMTLAFRNQILTFFVVLSVLMLATFLLVAGLTLQQYGFDLRLPAGHHQIFWFLTAVASDTAVFQTFLNLGLVQVFAAGGLFYLRHLYRKASSTEVFFAAVFLLGLSMEGLRVFQPLILQTDTSFFFGILVSRVVLLFRIFSVLALFVGSLYLLDFKYQKFGVLVGFVFGLSLMIAANVPLDTKAFDTNLLYGVTEDSAMAYFFIVFQLVIAGNILLARLQKRHHATLLLLSIAALLLTGWQLALFNQIWAPLPLIGALVLLDRRSQNSFQWG